MWGPLLASAGSAMAAQPTAAAAASPAPAAASDWHATVRDFASKHFKNPAWGYSHSMRDYALARELAAANHVTLDDDVLFAAAYLHDMAAFPPWEIEILDHSDVAAGIVDTVLKGTGFPMAKIDAVRGANRRICERCS
jgi:HD superfamily phosphodiesterase